MSQRTDDGDATEDAVKAKIDIHLSELEMVRELQVRDQNAQVQLLGYSLLAAGVVVPIIVGVGGTVNPRFGALILLALPLLYAGMIAAYLGCGQESLEVERYLALYLNPKINALVNASDLHRDCLMWIPFRNTQWRYRIGTTVLTALRPGGEVAILYLPALGAWGGFYFIVTSANLQWEAAFGYLVALNAVFFVGALVMTLLAAIRWIRHASLNTNQRLRVRNGFLGHPPDGRRHPLELS